MSYRLDSICLDSRQAAHWKVTMRTRAAIASTATTLALIASFPMESAAAAMSAGGQSAAPAGVTPGIVAPAAKITNVTITASPLTFDRYKIEVQRFFSFTDAQVRANSPFTTWVELWEQDNSDNDWIAGSKAKPVAPATDRGFTTSWNFDEDTLDGELGAEEIYAVAKLRNNSTGQVLALATRVLQIGV